MLLIKATRVEPYEILSTVCRVYAMALFGLAMHKRKEGEQVSEMCERDPMQRSCASGHQM